MHPAGATALRSPPHSLAAGGFRKCPVAFGRRSRNPQRLHEVRKCKSGRLLFCDSLVSRPSGRTLHLPRKDKGKNIGEKQHPMHGVVFSLFTQEGDKWNSLGKPVPLKGSFDWTEIRFTARIPEYLPNNSGNLIVGLHYATGTLLVKDVTVEKELELKFDEKIPEYIRRMRQIDLGFLALDRYGFHPYRLQKNLNRWYTLRSKLADMPERRRTHELDAMEQFLLGLSSQVLGTILSPNYLPDWEPDRLKKTRAEQEARYADWRIGAEVLTQAGLPCSVEDEIARIEAVRKQFPDGTVVTFSDIDRAAELYKKIAEERLRLGSELLSLRRELKAWTSAKILHPENAEPPLGQLSPPSLPLGVSLSFRQLSGGRRDSAGMRSDHAAVSSAERGVSSSPARRESPQLRCFRFFGQLAHSTDNECARHLHVDRFQQRIPAL